MTNIEYIAACITLINIILFGIFILVSGNIIVKELKRRFKETGKEEKEEK